MALNDPFSIIIFCPNKDDISKSCVATIKLELLKLAKSASKENIFFAFALSRLPVGSSAKIILGLWIIDLAIATLCLSPPDNLSI